MSDDGDSDLFLDTDSSEDDELDLINEPRIKNQNYLEEIIPQYTDEVFMEHFRLSRDVMHNISQQFATSAYYNNQVGRYGCIPATDQVIIYLWYIGHQTSSFRDVGDRFNITISSVYRIVRRMTLFLSNLSSEVIQWPNDQEKLISEDYFRQNGFPNIIGAIDGSHIKIDRPKNDPDSYINRKGFFSVQIQVVCNHRRKILDVFVGYPGSVHDSRVFRNSPLQETLREKCGRYFLLGDSGYPLQENLLTPYKDRGNLTRRQRNYNIKLAKNRYVVEHCFGLLKQKFRQLYHIKLKSIPAITHLIRAACVLHNIALDDTFLVHNDDQLPDPNIELPELEDDDDDHGEDILVHAIRDRVASNLDI